MLNRGFLMDGDGWRLSPLYDVVPNAQVGLERRLVRGGTDEPGGNALAGAAAFNLAPDDATALVADLRTTFAGRWEPLFAEIGLSAADRG